MIELSTLVKTQFPEYVQAEGPNLIAFVEAYYEWFEQSQLIKGRDLSNLIDIDSTIDEFVTYFRSTYLHGLPNLTRGDLRQFVKNSKDFYEAKGTEKSIQLLLRLLYDVEAEVYSPGVDILRASAGDWYSPTYIEVTPESNNKNLINKQIIGATSGARAIVESVVRRITQGGYYDVLYLSSVTGSFQTTERVTANGSLAGAPIIIGSLNTIQIVDGGKDNEVGDVFEIISPSGKQGRARVVEVENGTGRVEFKLVNGGTGYTVNAEAVTATRMFNYDLISGSGFERFETVEQRLHKVATISGNNVYAVGDVVNGYTSGTWILQATGKVMAFEGNTSVANVTVEVSSGDFRVATTLRTVGNTVSSVIDTVTNITSTANVVGANSTLVGVFNVNNNFIQPATLRGISSNTVAIIANTAAGFGAAFKVASIENEESVLLATDFWSQRNSANVPYTDVGIDGSGSGVGFVDGITITNAGTGYSNGAVVTFTGGGKQISSITISAGGTGYANGQLVTATGTSYSGNTLISIITNGSGTITALNVVESGTFRNAPTLTIANTSGTGATLTAVLGNPTTPASGTVSTNGSGAITSVSLPIQGSGYFSTPSITISGGGSGAVLTPQMDYGYGLPKNIHGDLQTIIGETLEFETVVAGTISGLKGISPGQDYTTDPFVAVVEDIVAGLDRRDFNLALSNTQGNFIVGEIVEQNIISPTIELTVGTLSGNTAFSLNEILTQANTNALGIIYYRDPTTVRVRDVTGTFVIGETVEGSFSSMTAVPTAVNTITQLATAKGEVRAANSSTMILKRTSINAAFNPSGEIEGRRSGATATVASFTYNYNYDAMGNNAVVTSTVKTANGIATSVEVIDSGYGYAQDEDLELVNPDNVFMISGRSQLIRQGTGEGFWRSTAGFLSNDKRLHDGKYYQAFSYEIQTELSLDRYSDVLKKIVHVAGMEMFGKVVLTPLVDMDFTVPTQIRQPLPTINNYQYNFTSNTYMLTERDYYLDYST